MRPNIVLILADDMGFSDLGCYGSEIHTPNLDKLAQDGVRFTQFYNCARCCPTRASLLTGLYPHQAGVGHMVNIAPNAPRTPEYQGFLNDRCVTIAEVLGGAGYATMMTGKWHVGGRGNSDHPRHRPLGRGFERFWGIVGGASSYHQPGWVRGRDTRSVFSGDESVEAEGYLTDLISDHAVRFIEEAPGDKPFFLHVAYTAPHWPLHALPEDIEKYRDAYRAGWDEIRSRRHARLVELGILNKEAELTPRNPAAPAWNDVANKEWQAHRMAVYAAQIDRMDRGIGRIVKALEARGILQDTLIMFLSDNGGCAEGLPDNDPSIWPGGLETWASYGLPWANASNTPFRLFKHWTHEGGICTPFIAHWPKGAQKGAFVHEPCHVIDVMATCVELAGAEYPAEFDGRAVIPPEGTSLVPLLRGGSIPDRLLFWEHEGNRAVRQGRWKLVSQFARGSQHAIKIARGPVDESWHLYDIASDRTETRNLAADLPDKVEELARAYDEWAARTGVVPWPEVRTAG